VTVSGRPVTQQPGPEQLWNDWLKALPPLAAVMPVDGLSFSFSVVFPWLLTTTVAAAEPPAATVSEK
jgi:hypothetical protein